MLQKLTDGLVGDKRLVIKAEDSGDVVEIRMLSYECPLCVIQPVVEIGYGDLDAPIVFIVKLHMPVHSYRTHMMCAL